MGDKRKMTEEELEKFTVDFMNNETGTNWSRIDSIMGKMLIKYAEVFQKRIEELEKENAELKLEALEGQIPWKDIKDKSEVIGQLTKAKDLIEILLSDNRIMKAQFESEEQANIWFEHIHQAEQFLNSEVGK